MLDAYPILTLSPPLMAIVTVIVTKKVLVSMGAGVVVAGSVLAEFNPVTMVVWMASSVASTAMLGAAPLDKAGMASSVEAVSYEFGTLLSVAVFGALLPFFYAMRASAEVAGAIDHGVEHPVHGPAAITAYDEVYLWILIIVGVVAALAAAVTAYCFRGNP